jgi:hypothetical protein
MSQKAAQKNMKLLNAALASLPDVFVNNRRLLDAVRWFRTHGDDLPDAGREMFLTILNKIKRQREALNRYAS